ncbi:DUF423 domain-containing protein [Oceanimonas doudoroffii]|uniref:DUF423 domain-containing protein n=1 Tax=Oceanimonas doudoroffii TaxID=84158 RepID=A0A233RIB2_9GAMM|nr:DUF423 domain-containing protein [Oceanimonas doudoroffii]OXY83114.1 hypothetical protein B6S08_06350 [Oceanimonas doudoroffii]
MSINLAFYGAALFGLTGTALGAYGAHGLAAGGTAPALVAAFNTGVQYQFLHALALLLLAVMLKRRVTAALNAAVVFFVLGILMFSGSIYALVLFGARGIGFVTPLGGVSLMVGWLCLLLAGRIWLRSE